MIGAALLLLSLGCRGRLWRLLFSSAPAAGWLEKAPYSLQQLQLRLASFKKPMAKVAQASGAIENLAAPSQPADQNDAGGSEAASDCRPASMLHTTEFVSRRPNDADPALFSARLRRGLSRQADQADADALGKKRAVAIAHEIEGADLALPFYRHTHQLCLGTGGRRGRRVCWVCRIR